MTTSLQFGSRSRALARPALALLAGLLVSAASLQPSVAEPSDAELAAQVQELRAQLRALRTSIDQTRSEARHTKALAREIPATRPGSAPGPAAPAAIPPGAMPVFVTADQGMSFGAITITPGGFIAAESVFRSRSTQSDMDTDFRALPFGNSPLAHAREFKFSARQTRLALLAEGDITPSMIAAGYVEVDFRSAANTANYNEANGFNPRVRNLYATLDETSYGLHVLAGQNWSLAVLNSKGITPRNEVTPGVIEGKYVPGFVSVRQPGIRLTKDFGEKLWLSLSAEQSQTTFATACPSGTTGPGTFGITGTFGGGNTLTGITCTQTGTGGGLAGDTNAFSLNHVPDLIAKAAYELRLGERNIHFEGFGLYRDFYDRVAYTDAMGIGQNANRDTSGYGVGFGFIVPILPRKLDFQASGIYGRGVGRYGTDQLPDTTVNADGSLRPIRDGMLLGGLVYHATPAIDLYTYAGVERQFRSYTASGVDATPYYGFGAPALTASTAAGCGLEPNVVAALPGGGAANPCAGNIKQIFQITGGMWDNIYKGDFGQIRVGLQYSFTERQIYNTIPGYPAASGATVNSFQPRAYDHMVFTSLRYFPFK